MKVSIVHLRLGMIAAVMVDFNVSSRISWAWIEYFKGVTGIITSLPGYWKSPFSCSQDMPPITKKHNRGTRKAGRAVLRSQSASKPKVNQVLAIRPKRARISKRDKQTSKAPISSQKHPVRDDPQFQKAISSAERRECHPEDFPDLDFHNSFGSFLTRKNPVSENVDTKVAHYWNLLSQTPTVLQQHIHDIGDQYRDAFRRFFMGEPISLHGHVSDASNPALLTSLICHLVSHASSRSEMSKVRFLDEKTRTNPRVAVTVGSYRADAVQLLANSLPPVVIDAESAARIDAQVEAAKALGYVELIAEIVSARDGNIISERVWKNLLNSCARYNLVLVVDEALTSIRCGAPFAHQLPKYCKHGLPDMIRFGKAVRTNGVAIDWQGINVKKLGIVTAEDRQLAILDWQARLTEMAQAANLLISWGTLVLTEREQWPQRGCEIGRILRSFALSEGTQNRDIGGLGSLIYLRCQVQARFFSPVMGAKAGNHVRWLPVMDAVMMSTDELRSKIFGPGSIAHRKEISAYLKSKDLQMGFCSRCGAAVEAGVRACDVCVFRNCQECEPRKHICPNRSLKTAA
ncbi:MAG: hypothetical protein Q9181_003372 [Wetmoreana brouardii]